MAAGKDDEELNEAMRKEPTKVGKKLTELTTRRLIILVLCMLITLPFLDGSLLSDDIDRYQVHGLEELHHLPQDLNVSSCVGGGCIAPSLFKSVFQVCELLMNV